MFMELVLCKKGNRHSLFILIIYYFVAKKNKQNWAKITIYL